MFRYTNRIDIRYLNRMLLLRAAEAIDYGLNF